MSLHDRKGQTVTDKQRISLRTALESWNGFLTDRCYALKLGDDIGALLPEWIDTLCVSVVDIDEGRRVFATPYIRILLEYWDRTMHKEVEQVLTKGWSADLVPETVLAGSAAESRDQLDEGWVQNLMVEYHRCQDLYWLMDGYAQTDSQAGDEG